MYKNEDKVVHGVLWTNEIGKVWRVDIRLDIHNTNINEPAGKTKYRKVQWSSEYIQMQVNLVRWIKFMCVILKDIVTNSQ